MFTYNCRWLPCLDGMKYRSAYKLQFTVPEDYVAICNGDLKVSKSNVSSSKSYWIYEIDEPILSRDFAFAVGPFEEITLNDILPSIATDLSLTPTNELNEEEEDGDDEEKSPETSEDSDNKKQVKSESDKGKSGKMEADDDENNENENEDDLEPDELLSGDDQTSTKKHGKNIDLEDDFVKIKLWVLPDKYTNDTITSCYNIARMIKVYERTLDLDFPFKTLSFVFVDEAYKLGSSYLNLNILSTELIHNEYQIEQSYETNSIISRCIADNWMNYALNVDEIRDLWIKIGFAGLLHYEWLRIYEGKNEMEYRKAMWRLHREETGPHPHQHPVPPLSWNGYLHEQQLYVLYYDYMKEKSMLVVKMLQQLLGSQSFDRNVMRNIIYGHSNGKFTNKYRTVITTKKLKQHLCGIFSAKQIDKFFHDFIYGDSCPKICAEYSYRKKDNRHILHIKQEHIEESYSNVIGSVKLQIQELEHETIEYIHLPNGRDNQVEKFEFVCQSKAKRKHKNANDNEPWLESPANNDTPTKWVRIDPDYEWLLHCCYFIVDPKIAITQLLHDDIRDVKSQIEAIHSLRFVPSKEVSEALLQTLNDDMNFYKVRLEAAKALAQDRNPGTLHDNKQLLIDIINKLWRDGIKNNGVYNKSHKSHHKKDKHNSNQDENDNQQSRQLINYFLVKNITSYLSTLTEHKFPHYTPIEIVNLIVKLLKELIDDNIQIPYCQESLTASMILNLGNIRVNPEQRHQKLVEITQMLSNILSLQRLFKSHRGVIHSACLKTFTKLYLNHPNKSILESGIRGCRRFLKYGRWHDEVRVDAFEMQLKIIKECKRGAIKRCLKLIAAERVPGVRLKMLKVWAKHNIQHSYFTKYESIADEFHRDQTQQTMNIHDMEIDDSNDADIDNEPKHEEKLDAINLRPTLRDHRSKIFAKGKRNRKSSNTILEWEFIPKILLNSDAKLNQQFISDSIWNLMLRCLDKQYSDKHRDALNKSIYKIDETSSEKEKNKQPQIGEDRVMIKSMDCVFGLYEVYRSIWGYSIPPFYPPGEMWKIWLNDNVGNQKRVNDACQQIRKNFNNNLPQFLCVGKEWQTSL